MTKTTLSMLNQQGEKKVLFCESNIANNFWLRLKGLLGKSSLADNEALIITPCSQVHTIAMRFPIDVIFVDKQQCVTKTVEHLKPYRQAMNRGAHGVIEVAAGMIQQHHIIVGTQLAW